MRKITIIAAFGVLIASCTMQKRHYTKGFYVNSKHHRSTDQKTVESQNLSPDQMQAVTSSLSNEFSPISDSLQGKLSIINFDKNSPKIEDCDIIILRSGEEIKAKVNEITLAEVKYKKCDNQSGPTISIDKKDVFMIKYANGTKDIITTDEKVKNTEKSKSDLQVEPFSVTGFILSFLGGAIAYFVFAGFGLFLLVASIVLCVIGLVRIKNNKNKFKGKGFAILGIILSLFSFIGALAILSLV